MHGISPDRVDKARNVSVPISPERETAENVSAAVASIMDKVGRKILDHFNANRVTLSRIDIHHGTVIVTDSWQLPSAPPAPAEFNIDDFYDHWMVSELLRGRLVAIDDVGSDSRTAGAAKRFDELSIRSSLHSPYLAGGDQVFKLAIHKPRAHVWSPDEKDLCRELTASIFLRLERSAGNQRLRESEARLRMATETAEMFVWEADLTANKMIWAENAPKILGCSPGDLPTDLKGKWFFIHPDDRERVDREFQEAIAQGRRQFSVGYRGQDQGGESTFWVVQSFVMADPEGNAVRLLGTTQNVTRLRRSECRLQESEERLRLILDSVMDHAIVTQTAEGLVTGWNPGAVKTFGYQADEIIGQPIDVLFTPEDRAAGVPQDEMITARKEGRAEDERWHMRKDGSRFYASGVLSPLRGGSNTGFVKVARDLTAKQRAEEELRRAREELEVRVRERTRELNESNKALRQEVAERVKSEEARVGLLRRIVTTQEDERGRIARDLHDQLGQRLTALRLKIASLRSVCGDNEELHKRVENLEAIGARLDAEVSFLAWELRPRALDDLGLATAVENFVTEWSNHFDIPAEFHSTGLTEQRFEPEIETNLYRITQEALNNVFKHAKATNASVILERRGDEVILVVEDNGKGFEADARGSNMLDSHTGRGLGLVGMSERAAIVGGSLEIESSEGSGTTVFVRVPARYADSGGADGK